jgi:hypothetical protein
MLSMATPAVYSDRPVECAVVPAAFRLQLVLLSGRVIGGLSPLGDLLSQCSRASLYVDWFQTCREHAFWLLLCPHRTCWFHEARVGSDAGLSCEGSPEQHDQHAPLTTLMALEHTIQQRRLDMDTQTG